MNIKKILLLWVIFAILDPDPLNRLNPDTDPDPQPWFLLHPLWVGISNSRLCSAISRTLWPNITTGMASSVPLSPYQFFSSQSLVTLFTVLYPEMEFLDIGVTKDSISLCYSQSLPLADFKKSLLFSGFKNPCKKIREKRELSLWLAFFDSRKPDQMSCLRRLEFMPRRQKPRLKMPFKNSISSLRQAINKWGICFNTKKFLFCRLIWVLPDSVPVSDPVDP